jgi:hypothetical protein
MSTIREVLRQAARAVTAGAAFELIILGSFSAAIVGFWLMVQRGML